MTTNEAFEILNEIKILDDSMYQYNIKYLEALDMAIKALKQYGALQEIRQEIADFEEEVYHEPNTDYKAYASVRYCLDIINKHIKEIEE